ncbi:unnamed protein product [Mytilus edulis]|uniref:Vwde helical domain-containing protein n=1 Tax=Mytilus edulis TaxID=6550 RepID=A0A8S3V6G3_MYTED|nr:unnamed protein product [Mytilus edulis]
MHNLTTTLPINRDLQYLVGVGFRIEYNSTFSGQCHSSTIRWYWLHDRELCCCCQAASDVFVIYGCDKKNKWFIRRLNCDKSHGAYLEIFERSEGREFTFRQGRVKFQFNIKDILILTCFRPQQNVKNSHGLWRDFNGKQAMILLIEMENNFTGYFKKHWSAVEGLEDSLSVKGCVNDIRVSGTTEFAEQSIRAYKSSCINEVQLNTSLWSRDSKTIGTTLLDDIVENDCPNDCNVKMTNRGNCVNGFCQCFSGFAGDDCSVSTNQPPALTATFTENKCDVNKTVCMEVPVFGTNFHKSQYLQCRFQEKELNHTDSGHKDTTHLLNARMISFAEIACPLPDNLRNRKRRSTDPLSPKAFLISITTTGKSFSNQMPVIIYDSACSDCEITGTSMKCNLKNNICVVEDKCYSLSSTMCRNTVAKDKSKSMLWIIGAALGGLAITSIVIVILAKLKRRKG